MRFELRIILATFLAGVSDLILGVILVLTGVANWWYNTFHLFGMLGFGMIAYSFWHYILYRRDKAYE